MRALIGSGGTLIALWLAGCSSSATSQGAGSGIGGSAAGSSGAVSSTGTPSSTGASGSASAGSSPPSSSADRFPASSIIYDDVSGATPDPSSAQVINHLQAAGGWGGSGIFQIDFSITILHADSTVVPRAFPQLAGY
jgi:hypothetical protein